MFQENNFRRGAFVTLGYLKSEDVPKRIYPSEGAENAVINFIKNETGLSEMEINSIKNIIEKEEWKGIISVNELF